MMAKTNTAAIMDMMPRRRFLDGANAAAAERVGLRMVTPRL
jgi:hypothetical protein